MTERWPDFPMPSGTVLHVVRFPACQERGGTPVICLPQHADGLPEGAVLQAVVDALEAGARRAHAGLGMPSTDAADFRLVERHRGVEPRGVVVYYDLEVAA